VPCVQRLSGSAPVPSSAPEAAGASRHRDPSPSVAELSSGASASGWYTQCERKVLEDGYPLEPQVIPTRGTASAPLPDVLALNAEVTANANIQAATQTTTAARLRLEEARAAAADFRASVLRRRHAWEHLIDLLGDDAFGSTGSKSSSASRPAASDWKGKGNRVRFQSEGGSDGESDDAGDASAVEGMSE